MVNFCDSNILIFLFYRSKKATKLVKLGKGLTSLTFAGKNKYGGDDLYVTAARKYLSYSSGKFKGNFNKKAKLYRVCSGLSGVDFKRTTVVS